MAINFNTGVECYQIYEKSVNLEKFHQYLSDLRNRTLDRKICVFMDNLSVHRSKKTLQLMDTLGLRYIFNAPYSPDYNPIEFVFSMLKSKYKKLRISSLVNGPRMTIRRMIDDSIAELELNKI